MASYLKIKLCYGAIARNQRQKDTLRGLGLRRRHQERILNDTPAIRGMIRKVYDLVEWQVVASPLLPPKIPVVTYQLGPVKSSSASEK